MKIFKKKQYITFSIKKSNITIIISIYYYIFKSTIRANSIKYNIFISKNNLADIQTKHIISCNSNYINGYNKSFIIYLKTYSFNQFFISISYIYYQINTSLPEKSMH